MAAAGRDRSKVWFVLLLGVLHHTRPKPQSLGVRASITDWPARFAAHITAKPKLDWRGRKDIDDLLLFTVRWTRDRAYPTHVGILGAWLRLPTSDLSSGVVIVASCASYAAFSLSPAAAYRYFSPPHAGFSRPASFLLAPFAQSHLMGLVFALISALSCGPELERAPGSPAAALSLFVCAGIGANFVGTRIFDDRTAASCASSGAQLCWLAAVAARNPSMLFNVYGFHVKAWVAVCLNAVLAVGEGAGWGKIFGLASSLALGASVGFKLENPAWNPLSSLS